MNAMTLVTALQRLAQCLLVSSLLVITGTSQAIERVTYYHNDALGSPVAATDAAGTLLWREEYKPYGDRIKREAGSKDTAWYTGKQEEAALGISYFGARWYDPKIGRFLAKDPVGFNPDNIQSFSKYAYANNNPYKYLDPDGNVVETALDIVSFGLSLAAFKSDPSLINALGLAYDGAATAIPFLPAGFGIIKNVGKGIDAAGDVTKRVTKKLSKVKKDVREETIGDGKFTKETKVIPGKGPGQSRAEMEFVKNSEGKLIRSRKFSFDRGNKFQGKKPARGGPEGRSANEN